MANGLPPPARIPSSEAIRKAALARSAKRGARVAAWRVGFRWLLWGCGKALVGLGALTAAVVLFMGLRWGWLAAQARWAEPLPQAAAPTPPASAPASATASVPAPIPASAPAVSVPDSVPYSAPEAPPAAAPEPRRSFPLRLDDSEPTAAPKRTAAGAQSPATRNTETQRP